MLYGPEQVRFVYSLGLWCITNKQYYAYTLYEGIQLSKEIR